MLTVVTFKYSGARNIYQAGHVNALQLMLKQHLTIPHRMVCITDDPHKVKCNTYPLWQFPEVAGIPEGRYNNYVCLKLFDIAEIFGEQLLVLDLDLLINKNINHLITKDDFKIIKGQYAPYNSSMYLLKSGTNKHVWDSFDPLTVEATLQSRRDETGERLVGTDQAWMSYCIPDAPTWDVGDGVYRYNRDSKLSSESPLIYFAGNKKPWDRGLKRVSPNLYRQYTRYFVAAA